MPREWHDRHSVNTIEDVSARRVALELVADKKPYFMRYIYPVLMRQYNTYIANTNKNCMREFGVTVDELRSVPATKRTGRQDDFLRYYEKSMPVGLGDCVMNIICRKIEDKFNGFYRSVRKKTGFDYSIMKSGRSYSRKQYDSIYRIYNDYQQQLKMYSAFVQYEHIDDCSAAQDRQTMVASFQEECAIVCPDRFALCDIILDICYKRSATKAFAWDMCGNEIIQNLLAHNKGIIHFPTANDSGLIHFHGEKFSVEQIAIGGEA